MTFKAYFNQTWHKTIPVAKKKSLVTFEIFSETRSCMMFKFCSCLFIATCELCDPWPFFSESTTQETPDENGEFHPRSSHGDNTTSPAKITKYW